MELHLGIKFVKFALGAALLLGLSACENSKMNSKMTDKRDGKVYKTVKIGVQTWMAENLNYAGNGVCYENEHNNCGKWGRLYTWHEALNACPEGWHLPSEAEWKILIDAVGGEDKAGLALKAKNGWKEGEGKSGNGTEAFGFSALPAGGSYDRGRYYYAGEYAYFWSSTEHNSRIAYFMYLYYDYVYAGLASRNKGYAFSIRCLENSN
ncbi:MAG: fibrobacter succinogenes major paralogous domain-containing protein [Hallerella porci]|uniref:Uncharacterized protein (TIGR02145 family) n=1 Tax=Hallerella porci TaxID=1945871 RepID=A0ABX5LM98_9BACT|nr:MULTISPECIES: fibrobacter succinogenes major paralogous domain-containing protein [Hallerella]MCI5599736.1 fibrobacter succinogenes major paralogous domain-containing protein [Hallerella sp.]MDY3922437.1 fibrobacter succinogenes major paralogous domain-containing protein [Hallerella porci]PWK94489.1 uncharacterized protein (TIGR02145 family) [Hallerella porci]